MRKSLTVFVVGLLFLAAGFDPALGVTLDQEGGLQYWCDTIGQVQGSGDSTDGGYIGSGKCTHSPSSTIRYWEVKASFNHNVVYPKGDAKETVKVYTDPGHTNEIGKIAGVYKCPKNPFIFTGVSCDTVNFAMTLPQIYGSLPYSRGFAASWWANNTGTSQQGLSEGTPQQDDLADWQPFTPAPGKLMIVKPTESYKINAGSQYQMVLDPQGPAPAQVKGEFQSCELVDQVGDISIPGGNYPTNCQTISGPLSPNSSVNWQNLTAAGGDKRSLALHTGSNSPFKVGAYRVRVAGRGAGQSWSPWEDWRNFSVGGGKFGTKSAALPKGVKGTSAKSAAAQASDPSTKPKMGGKLTKAKKPVTKATFGEVPRLKKPSLWFDTTQPIATITVELNKSFGASLYVKNIGEVANGSGIGTKVKLVTTCTAVSPGGSCTKVIDPPTPVIQPGQSKTAGHIAMFKIDKYGDYKVKFSFSPTQTSPARREAGLKSSWEWDISLKNPMKAKPAATMKKPPAARRVTPQPASEPAAQPEESPREMRRIRRVPTQ